MIFTSDLRYVSGKEELIARLHGVSYSELFDIRRSVLGRWLVGRPALMKVNEVLLAHGGVAPSSSPRSVESVNDSLHAYMSEDLFYHWADTSLVVVTDSETAAARYETVLVMDSVAFARRTQMIFEPSSILWFRGYVESDTLTADLEDVLEEFGVRIHAVAHTPVTTIESRYDGKLIAVDLERAATEMLLLEWDEEGRRVRRWKLRLEGPPEPL
jgi:hypothetical protein